MKTHSALSILSALVLLPSAWAKTPTPSKSSADHKIFEVSAALITLSIGSSGDQHTTYKITRDTKVTINGAAADAGDLRAGMTAKVATGQDKDIATSISAKDAQRHPRGGRSAG